MGRAPECPGLVGPYALVSGPPMSRRSLRPQLNQIRGWVRQGRTDAWIAHQLEVTVQQIQAFKREQGLVTGEEPNGVLVDEEIDLRAEDDALIAAELDAAEAERAAEPDEDDSDEESDRPKRRRGRRGGRRGRRNSSGPLEATFDHGEEGYGLWLDPAVQDDATYAEYWAGHRPVNITVERDRIVIRRAGEGDGDGESGGSDPDDADA